MPKATISHSFEPQFTLAIKTSKDNKVHTVQLGTNEDIKKASRVLKTPKRKLRKIRNICFQALKANFA